MSCPLLFAQTSEGLFFKPTAAVSAASGEKDVVISVSKYDSAIRVTDADQFPVQGNISKVAALLGFIQLKLNRYAVIANTVEETGQLAGHTIYKVVQHSIVPVSSSASAAAGSRDTIDADEARYLQLLETQLTNATLFFSYTYDLTNSLQRNETLGNNASNRFSWKNCDTRFFWNHYLTEELRELTQQDARLSRFIQPVIYGYAKCVETVLGATPIALALITRRSRFRAGTRYFRRGIDEDGNVGNFNETEQILGTWGSAERHLFSLLQTRGSVPVYWAEINNLKYKPSLVLGENSLESTTKHFDQQIALYGDNYLVNLVNQKGYELPVKEAYEGIVKQLNNPRVHYNYFDFHHECRKMQWHRVHLLLDQLQEAGLKNTDVFHKTVDANGQTIQVISEQHSVVRTNCMDCLDRTNVVQSVLAHWVLQREFETAHILRDDGNDLWEADKNLLSLFQNLWADNADAVSFSYSGTGALKTDFTRTGKRTKAGAFNDFVNSASRYYQNNLTDGPRQDSYDLFLGNFQPFVQPGRSPFVDARPSYIQTLPTVMYAALTVLGATIFFPKYHFTSMKNLMFFLTASVVLALSGKFVIKNGIQFVNWPRLVQPAFLAVDGGSSKDGKGVKYAPSSKFYKPNNQKKSD